MKTWYTVYGVRSGSAGLVIIPILGHIIGIFGILNTLMLGCLPYGISQVATLKTIPHSSRNNA